MKSSELRRRYLAFFQRKGHTVVASDSLVPANDPTLLFTGAGMNQFKDYFLGVKKDMKRAASCQKCFRTGDVETVGRTASHLTFFEMLGNFSFGDYFKAEAIAWAWEFMTQELKISPDRLWSSVYEKDEEAADIWRQKVGLLPERIVRFGPKDNFWPSNAPAAGPNGPCGPCSEIYYDTGRCFIGKVCPDPDRCSPACPCGRFVEVWNLVFTQFDRQSDGTLPPLPAKNIDTGMGLERLAAVMQDKMSVFETDLFEPLIEQMIHLLRDEAPDVLKKDQRGAVYAIVDHARALTFLVGDGVVPSNEGRGYVLRMLLRKAARAGRALGLPKPFLYKLVPLVIQLVQEGYPELVQRRESIAKVILTEEERFQRTLDEKTPLLEAAIDAFLNSTSLEPIGPHESRAIFDAESAARFYDTHGLSYEEISDLCNKYSVTPPLREEFDKALVALQAKSKLASAFSGDIFAKDKVQELLAGKKPTEFLGYADLKVQGRVAAMIREGRLLDEVKTPGPVEVVLDKSPFYGEAGGQVGDAGTIEAAEGKLDVLDTQWAGSLLLHRAQLREGRVRVNDPVTAVVDPGRRKQVAQNHTATHLLHSALRKILGGHVMQAGSLVAPDHLRFDFSHNRGLSPAQKESVESLVNEWVDRGFPVSVEVMPIEQARKTGAMSLFGEKYGEKVRVVSIGDVSKELCGGTHLHSSGEVGLMAIVEEGSVAAGVRRIEALSNHAAVDSMKANLVRLEQEHERLIQRNKQLEQEKGALKTQRMGAV